MLKFNPFPLCLSSFSGKFKTVTGAQVNRQFNTEYGCVLRLFNLKTSIIATSVARQRGFTHMKLVKSDHRTSMNETTLSDCLIINWEGSCIDDFNPDVAINLWFKRTERGPGSSK